MRLLQFKCDQHTPLKGNPKADPKTIPMRHDQPMVKRIFRGKRYQGSWMHGIHIAATGFDTTRFGMKRKAITLTKTWLERSIALMTCLQNEEPCQDSLLNPGYGSLNNWNRVKGTKSTYHLSRVAFRIVADIHQPRINNARDISTNGRQNVQVRNWSQMLPLSPSSSSTRSSGFEAFSSACFSTEALSASIERLWPGERFETDATDATDIANWAVHVFWPGKLGVHRSKAPSEKYWPIFIQNRDDNRRLIFWTWPCGGSGEL